MADRLTFNIKDLNNVDQIIENMTVGSHDVRAVSMRKDSTTSAPTAITELTKITIYAATITTQNVTVDKNITKVLHGYEHTVKITAADGYKVPTTAPVVIGATGTYTRVSDTSATLVISNPTNAVSCTITGEAI